MGELKRELGLKEVVFFVVGSIIGSGIFIIPGLVAREVGSASLILWVIVGIGAIYMALCVADLAGLYPHAGGPFKYVKEAFGEFPGFITGWGCLLIAWITIPMVTAAAVQYLGFLFPILLTSKLLFVLVGILIIGGITFVNYRGIRHAALIQIVFSIITILVLWVFISWDLHYIDMANLGPPYLPVTGLAGAGLAAAILIQPFIGWESVTFLSEETKNPRRNIPLGLIYGTIIVVILYIIVAFTSIGVVGWQRLGSSYFPLATVAQEHLGTAGVLFITIGAVVVIMGCVNSWVNGSARLPFALAREKLFPKLFSNIHPKHNTPYISLVIQAVASSSLLIIATLMGTSAFEWLLVTLVPLALIIYILMFISLPALKYVKRVKELEFHLPLTPVIAAISLFFCIYLLGQVAWERILIILAMMSAGIPIYFYSKSKKQTEFNLG